MSIDDLTLEDISGIGPTTAKKLKEAHISSVPDLAICSAYELAERINCSKETAGTIIMQAKNLLYDRKFIDSDVSTATEYLEHRNQIERLKTGSKELDDLLKGGIETEAITEFYAEFGSGKTQVCHTLAVLATLPVDSGGLNGSTIYVDTENTFRPERIQEISQVRELDTEAIMSQIIHIKAFNRAQFELLMNEQIDEYLKKYNTRLLVVDGILSQHRSDYGGRGTLSDRQQSLSKILSKLKRLAEVRKLAVVVTNQVLHSPESFFAGDGVKATGGNIIAHGTTVPHLS